MPIMDDGSSITAFSSTLMREIEQPSNVTTNATNGTISEDTFEEEFLEEFPPEEFPPEEDWTEEDWSGEDWAEEDWSDEDWAEEDWSDHDWSEEDWSEENWYEEDWTEPLIEEELPWENDDGFVPEWYQAYNCSGPYSKNDTDFVEDISMFYNYMVTKYNLSEAVYESSEMMRSRRWQKGLRGAGSDA